MMPLKMQSLPIAEMTLRVFANQFALQVYIARKEKQGTAVCFEPHGYVNAPNQGNLPSIMLTPGQRYDNQICYVFSEAQSPKQTR
tara:strand:+ start:337 stop:591 length:255 start_codon:yes stop_codon:yes gene_type:complete